MNPRSSRPHWALGLLALALTFTVAVVAYNAGLSQGVAQVSTGAATVAPPPPYPYGWHRPLGIWPLFPLMFIFFWAFVARGFWWGWGPRRYWQRGYGLDDRERFDEWHRRAHDQMKG